MVGVLYNLARDIRKFYIIQWQCDVVDSSCGRQECETDKAHMARKLGCRLRSRAQRNKDRTGSQGPALASTVTRSARSLPHGLNSHLYMPGI